MLRPVRSNAVAHPFHANAEESSAPGRNPSPSPPPLVFPLTCKTSSAFRSFAPAVCQPRDRAASRGTGPGVARGSTRKREPVVFKSQIGSGTAWRTVATGGSDVIQEAGDQRPHSRYLVGSTKVAVASNLISSVNTTDISPEPPRPRGEAGATQVVRTNLSSRGTSGPMKTRQLQQKGSCHNPLSGAQSHSTHSPSLLLLLLWFCL